jgi:hypothetical protein
VPSHDDVVFSYYEMRAGTIIERNAVVSEKKMDRCCPLARVAKSTVSISVSLNFGRSSAAALVAIRVEDSLVVPQTVQGR